ncbi:MAG: hypothetical protein H7222_06200, partial [Methylotenera sp.]|nr:hypothetical protein [Oligoflexia bacterium]
MAKPGKKSKAKQEVPAAQVYPDPSVVVIGDSWAALGAVGFLAHAGKQVCWVTGTGARALSPLPSLESGPGAFAWAQLAERLNVTAGPLVRGSFLREFRNKSFRQPAWNKSPTPQDRIDTRDEILWVPETRFAAAFESRFDLSLANLEEQLRKAVMALPNVERIENVPVNGVDLHEENTSVLLGSGRTLKCERIIYADRWSTLPKIEGLPKGLPFMRNRHAQGLLQAVFSHPTAFVSSEIREGFYGATNKEAGEEIQRSVFGYFFDEGRSSVWTLFLAADEVEDNHLIAKKLRRMKQALDRMFTGSDWIPEGKADFMATVQGEQVRFEESFVFGSGTSPSEPLQLGKSSIISFMTDGYGPASSFQQVAVLLGQELAIEAETSAEKAEAEFLNPESAGSGATGESIESESSEAHSASTETSS